MTSGATICAKCGHSNPGGTFFCVKCNSPTQIGDIPTIIEKSNRGSDVPTIMSGGTPAPAPLTKGMTVAGRYEILSILGEGGMGAVYKARDREVDRLVALKVIQPELANNPAMLKRFKQELILARQITHRNV